MEMFELTYFLAVADHENMQRAARDVGVSPSSLSKAVQRLEDELSSKLFVREGRRIRLSDTGRALQARAAEIVRLENEARVVLSAGKVAPLVSFRAPEALLLRFGWHDVATLRASYPRCRVEMAAAGEAESAAQVTAGNVQVAYLTSPPATHRAVKIGECRFVTCVGKGHPLFRKALRQSVPVEQALEYEFVVPSTNIFGDIHSADTSDGWRNDDFPRICAHVSSVGLLAELVLSGRTIAYVPDYIAERFGFRPIKVTGCPYVCRQTIYRVCRRKGAAPWIRELNGG